MRQIKVGKSGHFHIGTHNFRRWRCAIISKNISFSSLQCSVNYAYILRRKHSSLFSFEPHTQVREARFAFRRNDWNYVIRRKIIIVSENGLVNNILYDRKYGYELSTTPSLINVL